MENELVELVMQDTRERMAKVIEHAKVEFSTVRTGRASPALIENLMVEYYGTDTALKSLANFSVPEPRLL
ncbi:MAG: ribosome recycling factor, partial [Acidimicrobiales bacterium]